MKKIILFPGQGSLKKELVIDSYKNNSFVKATFDEISDYCHLDIYHKLLGNENIDITTISYLIFAISVSTYRYLENQIDMTDAIFAGHSLGEITALACANAFNIETALKIINKRVCLASEVKNSGMYVVSNFNTEKTLELCKYLRSTGDKLWISCDNSYTQASIAGTIESLEKASCLLSKKGAKIHKLNNNLPYHCNLLDCKKQEFEHFLNELSFSPLTHIVLSDALAKPYLSEKQIVQNIVLQFTEPVRWKHIITYLDQQHYDECYEMGYSDILTKLISSFPYSWKFINYYY